MWAGWWEVKIEGGRGFLGSGGCRGGWETLISLAEVTGAEQGGSCCILKSFDVKNVAPAPDTR